MHLENTCKSWLTLVKNVTPKVLVSHNSKVTSHNSKVTSHNSKLISHKSLDNTLKYIILFYIFFFFMFFFFFFFFEKKKQKNCLAKNSSLIYSENNIINFRMSSATNLLSALRFGQSPNERQEKATMHL